MGWVVLQGRDYRQKAFKGEGLGGGKEETKKIHKDIYIYTFVFPPKNKNKK